MPGPAYAGIVRYTLIRIGTRVALGSAFQRATLQTKAIAVPLLVDSGLHIAQEEIEGEPLV